MDRQKTERECSSKNTFFGLGTNFQFGGPCYLGTCFLHNLENNH